MIHQNCLSIITTSKIGDLSLYIWNSRSTSNLSFWEQWRFSKTKCNGSFWFHQTNWTRKTSPSQGCNPSLNGRFCYQKVIQWVRFLRPCHFFEQDWWRKDPRPYWWRSLSYDLQISYAETQQSEILAKVITQFPIYVEFNRRSLRLNGPSWIGNCQLMPGVIYVGPLLELAPAAPTDK